MVKFSVVVSVYNIEKYIQQCIKSIVEQTYKELEIILVDDGSTDLSSEICDKFKSLDSRIVVIHKKNGGLVSARQAGTKIATGDYIAHVDGDDWLDLCYFECFAEIIKQYKADIVCSGLRVMGAKSEKEARISSRVGYYNRKNIEDEIFPILIEGDQCVNFSSSLCGKVFKREIMIPQIDKMNPLIVIGEDAAVTKPCISKAESLYIMDRSLYCYRYNPNSLTKSHKAFDWNGPYMRGKLLEEQIDMKSFDFQEQLYRTVVHSLFNVVVSQFNRKEPYRTIANDIHEKLANPYYAEAINKCVFKNWKGRFAKFALQHKAFLLIKLYHTFR